MTAFEIYVNDTQVCVAGLPEPGVISSVLTWIKGREADAVESFGVRVGGLISKSRTFVEWHDQLLAVGDEVRFKVCERKKVSKPKSRRRESAAQQKRHKLDALKRLAEELGYDLVKQRKSQ